MNKLFSYHLKVFSLIAALAIGTAFYELPKLYFLNDEFLQLGIIHQNGILAGINSKTVVQLLLGTGRPLGTLINNFFYYNFAENPLPFTIFAYIVHFSNTILLFMLIDRLTKNKWAAWFGGIFFALPGAAQQVISWYAAVVQPLGGLLFILLSLHFMLTALERKSKKLVVLSWGLGYISFLFKESSFFVFPLLLVLPWMKKRSTFTIPRGWIVGVVLGITAIGLYKIVTFFGMTVLSNPGIWKVVFNSVYYPFITISQIFIPYRFLLRVAPAYMHFVYPGVSDLVGSEFMISQVGGDIVSILASFILVLGLIWVYQVKLAQQKVMIFATIAYIASFLPIAVFLDVRNTSYIESRYLYTAYFGFSIWMGLSLSSLREYLIKKTHASHFISVIIVIMLAIFSLKQISVIRREVRQNVLFGIDIKEMITLMRHTVGPLPDHPVFYIQSDRDYFFPNNRLPYQLGSGYMTFLTFRDRPQIPKKLIGDLWLRWFFTEGYDEQTGVGYYWNMDHLVQSIHAYKIGKEQIVGLYFDSKKNTLTDITQSIYDQAY